MKKIEIHIQQKWGEGWFRKTIKTRCTCLILEDVSHFKNRKALTITNNLRCVICKQSF